MNWSEAPDPSASHPATVRDLIRSTIIGSYGMTNRSV